MAGYPLENLNLNNWYMYLLYVFGVIFIVSLFFPFQNGEGSGIITLSLFSIILGIVLWIIWEGIDAYIAWKKSVDLARAYDLKDVVVAWYIIEIVGFLCWVVAVVLIFA